MLTFLRTLGLAGTAGLVVSLALTALLVVQKGETRHWRKQSARFEQLYSQEQAALIGTIANYRAAADQARAADHANAERVVAAQKDINERTDHDYEARLADARAVAGRLRAQLAAAGAHSGSRPGAPVPGVRAPASGPPQAAGQDGFSLDDRLTATEQAIQLDELIKWVKKQAAIAVNGAPPKP